MEMQALLRGLQMRKFSRTLNQWLETAESVEEKVDKLLELNVAHALKWIHENVKNLKQD